MSWRKRFWRPIEEGFSLKEKRVETLFRFDEVMIIPTFGWIYNCGWWKLKICFAFLVFRLSIGVGRK